ncbi:M23 family metallopeptidase [Tenacibaculum finnmarkense]|uniref:M23 family metallopeptidase n=1 Tax=Tenacibaculum finnmarkense TaxID=2781243 RepID=UPI001E40B34F|nr:M23 family metallopeptidase [Tenacibaculum finnmarkense]MCD8411560.1 M23 family metallopeptidase [Tenacibaculum finnmarkense genomovar ulcerans]MCG8206426.1 M23 family metallopeptidase [Tenacibaculum finnmarkense genomovar finnmarkense]MCM8905376.1 M23 family metallopeptidase [Tenacibaculum finnmarkense genomovar finnmarkense]
MKFYFSIIFLLFFYSGNAQQQYPRNYFSAPLKIPIILSGTFGELRSNHFHSGIDIKTQGKQGIAIYAAANGYVSRIKVSQYGFGKAIYLEHPNGYTTVYAHLQKFEPTIEKYVKSIQYEKKNYQTGNLFTPHEQFPIKKGQIIGYTGDTGGSGGPHLHYEIRDTKTEHIINPLLFGITPKDDTAPRLQKIMAYPLNTQSRVNNSSLKSVLSFKKTAPNNYISQRITASGVIGFGVSVFDRLNGASNKNGIYSLEMKVNGSRVYYHDLETFSFAESKYINLLIDYKHYKTYKNRVQKTHKVKANRLNLYEDLVNNGKITIKNGASYNVEIIAKDIKHNTTTIKIPIKGVKSNLVFKEKDSTAYKIIASDFHKYTLKNVSIAFPKNTFYTDCFINFSIDNDIVKVHNKTVPIDKRYTLTFNTSLLTDAQKKQVYIANVSNMKYPRYANTKKKTNKIYTSTKVLGSYKLLFDSIKPTIKLYNFKNQQWLSKNKTLKVKIKDNQSGIKNFNATIDDQWILMQYNHKKGLLTYNFNDKKLIGSKHIFKLVVSDNVGNLKTLSAVFYKK